MYPNSKFKLKFNFLKLILGLVLLVQKIIKKWGALIWTKGRVCLWIQCFDRSWCHSGSHDIFYCTWLYHTLKVLAGKWPVRTDNLLSGDLILLYLAGKWPAMMDNLLGGGLIFLYLAGKWPARMANLLGGGLISLYLDGKWPAGVDNLLGGGLILLYLAGKWPARMDNLLSGGLILLYLFYSLCSVHHLRYM